MAHYIPSSLAHYQQLADAQRIVLDAEAEARRITERERERHAHRLNRARQRLRSYLKFRERRAMRESQALLKLHLASQAEGLLPELQKQALEIACAAVERIVGESADNYRKSLTTLLSNGLAHLQHTRQVQILAQPDEVSVVQTALMQTLRLGSCSVSPSDCPRGTIRLVSADGSIELSWRRALADFSRRASDLCQNIGSALCRKS